MNTIAKITLILIAVTIFIIPTTTQVNSNISKNNSNTTNLPEFSLNTIIVKYKNPELAKTEIQRLKTTNSQIKQIKTEAIFDNIKALHIEYKNSFNKKPLSDKKDNVINYIKILEKNPNIEYAEPDYYYYTQQIENNNIDINDEYYLNQWGIPMTKTNRGLALEQGSKDVIIAVIDSGNQMNHEDLKHSYLDDCNPECLQYSVTSGTGYDFVNLTDSELITYQNAGLILDEREDYQIEDANPDTAGDHHGTWVTGVISSQLNNNIGITGVCPNCSIMPLKAGFGFKNESAILKATDVIQAIDYAKESGADIINMSFGGYFPNTSMKEALQEAINNGIIPVAAAGNNNLDRGLYPAAFDGVISVGATNSSDLKASFSNYGNEVDISAPGEVIWTTNNYNIPKPQGFNFETWNYTAINGTSFSAPFVSGAIGLLKSQKPNISYQQVKETLLEKADKGYPGQYDNANEARINVFNMLIEGYTFDEVNLISPINTYEYKFTWEPVSAGEWYNLYVTKNDKVIVNEWYLGDYICNKTICELTKEDYNLPFGENYKWGIRLWSNTYGLSQFFTNGTAQFDFGIIELISPKEAVNTASKFEWSNLKEAEWFQLGYTTTNNTLLYTEWVEKGGVKISCEENKCSREYNASFEKGEYYWWVRGWSSEYGFTEWKRQYFRVR